MKNKNSVTEMLWTQPWTSIKIVPVRESLLTCVITKTASSRIICSWTTFTPLLKKVSTLMISWSQIFLIILSILTNGQVSTQISRNIWDPTMVPFSIYSLLTKIFSTKTALMMLLVTSTIWTVQVQHKESILVEFTKSNMFLTWFQVSGNMSTSNKAKMASLMHT